jgi:acyl dehydratase
MNNRKIEDYQAGDSLPEIAYPPLSYYTLSLYLGGSHDLNPIHVDPDHARRAGLDDVFGHGMLTMAYMGNVLTAVAPQSAIRRFHVRFLDRTAIGDVITCRAVVRDVADRDGMRHVMLDLAATTESGRPLLAGDAELGMPA